MNTFFVLCTMILLVTDMSKRTTFNTATETSNGQIKNPEFLNSARKKPQYFTRESKMPFVLLIAFMLDSIKSTIQLCLDSFFENIGRPDVHMAQQSFSDARDKIYWKAFRSLFRTIVDHVYDYYYDTWHGFRVLAIDGTKIQLPSAKKLKDHFGIMGKSAATAQASMLYDVLNNIIVDALLLPIKVGERKLAMAHLNVLCGLKSFAKELVIFDRGYHSFEMFEFCKERGISFLMRAKSDFNNTVFLLPRGDHHNVRIVQKGHDDMYVRVIKFLLPSGQEETLITNITDRRMKQKAFKELYFKRWPIETKYAEIKDKLEVENFSGRTINAIMQDFFISMYVSNMAAIACWDAQKIVDAERADKDNKHDYRVNVNHAIGTFKKRFILALLTDDPIVREKQIERIFKLLTKAVTPKRPNRSVLRNPSPRHARFHHNRKSNH